MLETRLIHAFIGLSIFALISSCGLKTSLSPDEKKESRSSGEYEAKSSDSKKGDEGSLSLGLPEITKAYKMTVVTVKVGDKVLIERKYMFGHKRKIKLDGLPLKKIMIEVKIVTKDGLAIYSGRSEVEVKKGETQKVEIKLTEEETGKVDVTVKIDHDNMCNEISKNYACTMELDRHMCFYQHDYCPDKSGFLCLAPVRRMSAEGDNKCFARLKLAMQLCKMNYIAKNLPKKFADFDAKCLKIPTYNHKINPGWFHPDIQNPPAPVQDQKNPN